MTTPINSDLNISVSIPEADLAAIKAEGFPRYEMSVLRFHHTTTPYVNVPYAYAAIAAMSGAPLDQTIPDWQKEIVAQAADTGSTQVLVRESHNSRFFYVEVVATAPIP
ncbi:hypothetical protein EniLVp02_0091 [Vibrio phage EniLVp02]